VNSRGSRLWGAVSLGLGRAGKLGALRDFNCEKLGIAVTGFVGRLRDSAVSEGSGGVSDVTLDLSITKGDTTTSPSTNANPAVIGRHVLTQPLLGGNSRARALLRVLKSGFT